MTATMLDKKTRKREYNRAWRARKDREARREAEVIVSTLLPDWKLSDKRRNKLDAKIGALIPERFKAKLREAARLNETSMSEIIRRRIVGLL